jgi:hypothetical protein
MRRDVLLYCTMRYVLYGQTSVNADPGRTISKYPTVPVTPSLHHLPSGQVDLSKSRGRPQVLFPVSDALPIMPLVSDCSVVDMSGLFNLGSHIGHSDRPQINKPRPNFSFTRPESAYRGTDDVPTSRKPGSSPRAMIPRRPFFCARRRS